MAKRTISNTDSVIDSRDVIERIDDLKDELELAYESSDADPEACDFDFWVKQQAKEGDEDAEEYLALVKLAQEGEDTASDWVHGETLVHDSYWVEYCRDLVADIGDLPRSIPDYIEIDWEKTADNLKADYSEVDYGGETYYIRSC